VQAGLIVLVSFISPFRAERELANFTGIDSPYEPPEQPELRLDTTALEPEDAARAVVARLAAMGVI
jgi:bifunctional enzyme CysN/CysC